MNEVVEVTSGKLYVLSYEPGTLAEYDDFAEISTQLKEHIPEEAEVLIIPNHYDLQEVSEEELITIKTMIEEVLKSRQSNS